MAERLLDDYPLPVVLVLTGQSGRTQLLNNRGEQFGRRRQVIEMIAPSLVCLLNLGEEVPELFIGGGVLGVSGEIVQALRNPVPELGVHRAGGKVLHVLGQLFAERFVRHTPAGNPHDGKLLRQEMVAR